MMMRMDEDSSHDESALADKMMVKRAFGGVVDNMMMMMMMMDQERSSTGGSSSEETESPRSVLVIKGMRRWSGTSFSKEKNMAGDGMSSVHSQILRIRYEDSHVGEDISEALSLFAKDHRHLASLLEFSKPILPSSPLGGTGKTIIKTSD